MNVHFTLTILSALLVFYPIGADAAESRLSSGENLGQEEKILSGTVVDSKTGDPLVGVTVVQQGNPEYALTDLDGRFTFELSESNDSDIEFSFIGYKTYTVPPEEGKITVRMEQDLQVLEESQVIAYGTQSKMSITGSITSIETKDLLKSPSGSAASALAGAVTGISSIQTSGQPGSDDPEIFVRGAGSLTSEASKPLILVDGVERSFFQMDPNEIESITVLKDAASTAVFGVRGANGVILVTTRRGEEGKLSIGVTSSFGLTQALRKLTGVDSYDYALLYTEAQKSDGVSDNALIFTPYITEMFRTNADPIMFPNVNWQEEIFKDLAWQTQHNVTMSGGGKRMKYFISLGYLHQDGVLKRNYETYNPNFMYDRFNYRTNIDVNVTGTTLLKLNIGGKVSDQRSPVNEDLWRTVMWCVPFSSPGFVDGKLIQNATNPYIPIGETKSPYDYYYNWGYDTRNSNDLNIDLSISQKLDFLTSGLSLNVKGAYNTTYYMTVRRGPNGSDSTYTPIYLGSITQPGMSIEDPRFDDTIIYRTEGVTGLDEPLSYSETGTGRSRNWYLEGSINYARKFGDHEITGLLLYNQTKTYYPSTYTDIPTGYVGYVGRITYAFRQKYMVDVNAGYNGSENFAPDRRYGFFPAGSVGWIVSSEKFMRGQKVIDFLKLRASYGLVGNDKYAGDRFLYIGGWNGNHAAVTDGSGGSWQFGVDNTSGMLNDAVENRQGNEEVTWEKAAKQNYGIDMKMFNYRLSLTADYFFEHRWDILSTRNTAPSITDFTLPLMNLGVVNNHGYEVSLGWTDTQNRKVGYWITANVSYSKNKIIYMDEVVPNEPYMAQTGRSTGLNYALEFDRFYDYSDFDAEGNLLADEDGKPLLPVQNGSPKPGDPLFKDKNNDGKIDGNDYTYVGYSSRPEYVFGLVAGIKWKGLEISMQWTGATHASRMLSGEYRTPFGTQNSRTLLKYLADGRWHAGNTENARFPRLTFTNKTLYTTASTMWLMDASYLRLKTAEISYTFSDNAALKKAGISSARIYLNGYNLLTLFSELAEFDIDPEGYTGDGAYTYPNNRIFNFGINLTF